MLSPSPQALEVVAEWIKSYGAEIDELSVNKDFMHIRCSVATCEQLLRTKFSRFVHRASGKSVIRSLGPYSAPTSVASHLDFIAGVLHFPEVKKVIVGDNPN